MELNASARSLLPAAALLFHVAMADTWYKQIQFWYRSATYQHAFLILPVFAYLIWRKRDALRRNSDTSVMGVVTLLILCCVWIGAQLVNIEIVEFSVSLLFFPMLIWLYTGTQGVRELWFPLSYIAFALPWWSVLSTPLQMGTAYAASEVLHLIDLPIYVDRQFIHIPSGTFEIEQACAGLHFLIVALALASLLAYFEPFSNRDRIKLILSAVALSLFVNWLRVVMVIVIGHATEMAHPWVQDHRTVGWVMFMFFLVPWFWWVWRWNRVEVKYTKEPVNKGARQRTANTVIYGALGLIMLSIGKWILMWSAGTDGLAMETASLKTTNWEGGRSMSRLRWNPVYLGAARSELREFKFEGAALWYFRAEYDAQIRGVEMVSSTNDIAGEGWEYLDHATQTLGTGMLVNIAQVQSPAGRDERRVILYWFEVDGRVAATAWEEKYLELKAWLRGYRPRASVYALASPYSESNEPARLKRALSLALSGR